MTDEELAEIEARVASGYKEYTFWVSAMEADFAALIAEVRRLRAKTVKVPVLGKVK